jgi:hypothetical protein
VLAPLAEDVVDQVTETVGDAGECGAAEAGQGVDIDGRTPAETPCPGQSRPFP